MEDQSKVLRMAEFPMLQGILQVKQSEIYALPYFLEIDGLTREIMGKRVGKNKP